jgi:hypothetical protein
MTPEEFERLKEEEKRHLRELRALKQQHREAQRKKGLLGALRGLTSPEADATHEEMLDRLTRQNAEAEARFEVAMEGAGITEDAAARRAREEAEREAVRKAEAEALVRQMKQEMGAAPAGAPPSEPSPPGGKTIGRVPPAEGPGDAQAEPRDPKTIGRPRQGA